MILSQGGSWPVRKEHFDPDPSCPLHTHTHTHTHPPHSDSSSLPCGPAALHSYFYGAEKAHKSLPHKTLSSHPGHRSSRSGIRTKTFMFLGLPTPRPATEPRNPETPKVHFKVRKMSCSTPPEKWAQRSIKMSKKSLFGPLIFRTLKCTFGVSGFRGSVAGRGVCNPWVPRIAHRSFDPWPPGRETPRSPEGSPAKRTYFYVPFFFDNAKT